MKMASKLFFFVLLLINCSSVFSCRLKTPVISLSGPVTMLLERINLLEDKNLHAISSFHPITKKYHGEILAGGLFLSHRTVLQFKNKTIIFDESRELEKLLERHRDIKLIKFTSRAIDSINVYKRSVKIIQKISIGCEKIIAQVDREVNTILSNIVLSKKLERVVFFLGKINNKLPETVIVRDGFVLELMKIKSFKTYPSALAYISWSKSILNKLKHYTYLGISEGATSVIQAEKIKLGQYNLSMAGALIPGISQIYFLKQFVQLRLE